MFEGRGSAATSSRRLGVQVRATPRGGVATERPWSQDEGVIQEGRFPADALVNVCSCHWGWRSPLLSQGIRQNSVRVSSPRHTVDAIILLAFLSLGPPVGPLIYSHPSSLLQCGDLCTPSRSRVGRSSVLWPHVSPAPSRGEGMARLVPVPQRHGTHRTPQLRAEPQPRRTTAGLAIGSRALCSTRPCVRGQGHNLHPKDWTHVFLADGAVVTCDVSMGVGRRGKEAHFDLWTSDPLGFISIGEPRTREIMGTDWPNAKWYCMSIIKSVS